ncbi:Coenzyme F420 hydrogenase/dehydrogenase, beta subunit C-terminal domain [Butyrivibrio sp. AC2005]|uniref:Coenzyme F420 hydrogenase/dehydrogenase, beta subunit C-terminal domain n=1 Tax=Butyrivibrio sp. AC2005 TaxID=1280672 RepID=UPI000424E876|nr:Coenzyme F420 hydrogenase/dehydrogenase, beta subunit C-terminal domain [Butyrivibrio sp. AC2005]
MEICNKENCTGCSACVNICPKTAISLRENEKGFLYPEIDKKKCVECGLCSKVCHINNDIQLNKVSSKYLFKNNDFSMRKSSSSGGSYMPMAQVVIKNGGTVFGAEFSDNLMVKHNYYKDLENIRKFCTSKYVQSDIGNTYKIVYELLKGHEKVLFSGSPCQVAGLKSYLSMVKCPTDDLITVDFICHGVGSPKFWNDCLGFYSKKFGSKAVSANFRGKPRPGKLQNLTISFSNGKKFQAPSANMEVFFYHFLQNCILRESCFYCKYSKTERVSDITMGDCFRAEAKFLYLQDGYGLSQLMANTEKGQEFIESIREYGDLVQVDVNNYIQPNLLNPTSKPQRYNTFWDEYLSKGFNGALRVSNYSSFKNRAKHIVLCVAYYLRLDSSIKKIARIISKH